MRAGANTLDMPLSFSERGPLLFGTLTDATDGKPVRVATVGIKSASGLLLRSDVTDYTGYYQLRDVPTGVQSFQITAVGYEAKAFDATVDGNSSVDVQLTRAAGWRLPASAPAGGPVARVTQPFIYLTSMLPGATLDATPSTGTNLRYLWRENPDNPEVNLLPLGTETMATIQVSGIPKPGIYRFELQVRQGPMPSANTAVITVFAPGLAGNVHASPSDGFYGLNAATVRAYNNYDDAVNWQSNANLLDSAQTADNPIGGFVLDGLAPGACWVVARAQDGAGFNQYGPVKRRACSNSSECPMASARWNLPCRTEARPPAR
ncbi:MAG: carboxypeptidase regulatory-like domain-containing protein [Verrucomicrobia bacterium]|nr:carboxypeptidase regulatory-like domain-containing protein [Verrucomicrobiota bacterium]